MLLWHQQSGLTVSSTAFGLQIKREGILTSQHNKNKYKIYVTYSSQPWYAFNCQRWSQTHLTHSQLLTCGWTQLIWDWTRDWEVYLHHLPCRKLKWRQWGRHKGGQRGILHLLRPHYVWGKCHTSSRGTHHSTWLKEVTCSPICVCPPIIVQAWGLTFYKVYVCQRVLNWAKRLNVDSHYWGLSSSLQPLYTLLPAPRFFLPHLSAWHN